MKLIPAIRKDIPTITSLAKSIWQDHYIHIITQDQIDYMLDKMYSEESLIEQMEKKHHQFFLVEEEEHIIGFISVKKSEDGEVFLNKFYLLTDKQKKGNGTRAFELLKQQITPFKNIRLTVNRQNFKAINFYFKNKFKIEKVEDFQIGNGYVMNDFVMIYE